jgi:hypothetical protein
MSNEKLIPDYIDALQGTNIWQWSRVHLLTDKISLFTHQTLLPFATKEQMTSAEVITWFTFVMPKLQEHWMNFHDAFSKAAQLWNTSTYSAQLRFRIPHEWSLMKRRSKEKWGDKENVYNIRKILWVNDTKQGTIARSLGLELVEIWPKRILWRNQFRKR